VSKLAQFKDEQYFDLSDVVYENSSLNIGGTLTLEGDESKWIVINSVNDPSGLQAIAVVPKVDYDKMKTGKITEYPNVVFSARGSQTDNWSEAYKDWIGTDFGDLTTGMKPSNAVSRMGLNVTGDRTKPAYHKNMDRHAPEHVETAKNMVNNHQFLGMERFVNRTLFDHDIADYSFTGHSLGGALAQYMAAIKDKGATTFAAARAYRLLPPEVQKMVDSGHFDGKIVDYRHEWDPVGHLPGGKVIGSQYLARTSALNIVGIGHVRGSFKGMFKNGAMQILFDPESIRGIATEIMGLYDAITDIQLAFRQYVTFEQEEIETFVSQTRTSSDYHDLESHEIEDILRELFPHKVGGDYSVHDPEVAETIDLQCRVAKEKMYQLSDQLTGIADKAEATDSEIKKRVNDTRVNWFSSLDVTESSMNQSGKGPRPAQS